MLSSAVIPNVSAFLWKDLEPWGSRDCVGETRTFEELAAVHLAGSDLEGDNVALQENIVSKYAVAELLVRS